MSSKRSRKEKEREIDGKKENGEERRKKGRKMQGKWRKEDSSVASKSKQMDEHGSGASAQLGEGITAQHLPPHSSTFSNMRGRLELADSRSRPLPAAGAFGAESPLLLHSAENFLSSHVVLREFIHEQL